MHVYKLKLCKRKVYACLGSTGVERSKELIEGALMAGGGARRRLGVCARQWPGRSTYSRVRSVVSG
jgi:hypothetical protein